MVIRRDSSTLLAKKTSPVEHPCSPAWERKSILPSFEFASRLP